MRCADGREVIFITVRRTVLRVLPCVSPWQLTRTQETLPSGSHRGATLAPPGVVTPIRGISRPATRASRYHIDVRCCDLSGSLSGWLMVSLGPLSSAVGDNQKSTGHALSFILRITREFSVCGSNGVRLTVPRYVSDCSGCCHWLALSAFSDCRKHSRGAGIAEYYMDLSQCPLHRHAKPCRG